MIAPLALLAGAALAGPFEVTAHGGAQDGHVYLMEGMLLVGSPDQEGRPGYVLTDERRTVTLPEVSSGYRQLTARCDRDADLTVETPVDSTCGRRPVAFVEGDLDGITGAEVAVVEAEPVPDGALLPYAPLYLSLYRDGVRVGEQKLDLTVFPCSLAIAEVDGDPESELIFAWLSAGGSGVTRGATVFRLTSTE